MYVIGTAGHIDHGKSTLIHRLTEMHPDRLQAERERGMTIDLGFAWLTLPSGTEIGIVDVPGHHRFIENMLAGVGGIRLTLFVVAANDGWMPQTEEHLEILDLLGVERGIVVLTKRDLVEEDWLELVQEDVAERLQGTVLKDAPMVAVSATTGEGMDELVATLDGMLRQLPGAEDRERPRLWVDRVFSIRGAGTVVTGTLEGGGLTLEQPVVVEPQGKRARVRGLQTHTRTVERAVPGTRVAVNLAGVETEDIARGDAVCAGPRLPAASYVNVDLKVLPNAPHALDDLTTLQLYVGSAAVACRLRLLDRESARPGERVPAQLWLERPLPLRFADRFVLRDKTYQRTVGGGRIVDEGADRVRRPSLRFVKPRRPWRLPDRETEPLLLDLDLLAARRDVAAAGPPRYGELVSVMLQERGVVAREELLAAVPLAEDAIDRVVDALVEAGQAVALPSFVVDRTTWDAFAETLRERLAAFHERYPLRPGAGRESVRTGLDVAARLFDETVPVLAAEGVVAAEGAHLRLPDHELAFTLEQQKDIERLLALLHEAPYAPPLWSELTGEHGFDVEFLTALVGRGDVVKVSDELLFPSAVVADVEGRVREHIAEHGAIDVAALRDMLQTSRKYALPLLEYFDRIDVTRRVGDKRVLAS